MLKASALSAGGMHPLDFWVAQQLHMMPRSAA